MRTANRDRLLTLTESGIVCRPHSYTFLNSIPLLAVKAIPCWTRDCSGSPRGNQLQIWKVSPVSGSIPGQQYETGDFRLGTDIEIR